MYYSVETRDGRYVKGYRFLSFAKNIGKKHKKKSAAGAIETVSKRAIQKTAEATGDLIGNKITDKVTTVSKNLQEG